MRFQLGLPITDDFLPQDDPCWPALDAPSPHRFMIWALLCSLPWGALLAVHGAGHW
jgi:hypothetical protein